jgi:hypothetical protein
VLLVPNSKKDIAGAGHPLGRGPSVANSIPSSDPPQPRHSEIQISTQRPPNRRMLGSSTGLVGTFHHCNAPPPVSCEGMPAHLHGSRWRPQPDCDHARFLPLCVSSCVGIISLASSWQRSTSSPSAMPKCNGGTPLTWMRATSSMDAPDTNRLRFVAFGTGYRIRSSTSHPDSHGDGHHPMTQPRTLHSDRTWKRMSVRSELGISAQAPWFALACTSPEQGSPLPQTASKPPLWPRTNASSAIPWLRDLAWHVPEAHFGALAMHCQHSGSLAHPVGWGTLSASVPTSMAHAHAGNLLDWMCAADGWLLWGVSPLDEAILEVATQIDLPTLKMDTPSIDAESLALEFHRRSGRHVRWETTENADELLERLQFRLEQALRTEEGLEFSSRERDARRAA